MRTWLIFMVGCHKAEEAPPRLTRVDIPLYLLRFNVSSFCESRLTRYILIRPLKADNKTSESVRSTAVSTQGPLLSTNSKAKRLESEKRSRWFVSSDEPRDHQTASLKTIWSPLLRSDACDILFPAKAGSMVSLLNMCSRYVM